MDCGRWPLSVVRQKVGRGLGLSGFWGSMGWSRSAGSLTPLALDSSLLDSFVVVVVGCKMVGREMVCPGGTSRVAPRFLSRNA